MNFLARAISDVHVAFLPVAAALLLEELTYGGLVRLLLAPRKDTGKRNGPMLKNGCEKCLHRN
jgi:hypothetical protein